jgi:hypothetical protein
MPQAVNPPPGQRDQNERCAYGTLLSTHQYPPLQGGGQYTNEPLRNCILKANINIASLNINGYAAPANNMNGIEKWSAIYQMMKENKIAILAVQETHLDNA